jgi:A/G-specific adenine glycosylase
MMLRHQLTQEEIYALQQLMLIWFEKHQRIFPWRDTRNPFNILIAEKLLQQTSVGERVVTAYLSIINKFPNPLSLSQAKLNDLSELIAPLGLHYRAQELIQLASAIEAQYQGELPNDYKKLLALPGIGEYTARAILSFAYDENIAVIDTNVARILFRIFDIDISIPANPARKKFLINLATSILPDEKSRDFNFAILDLCADICKPKNPACVKCPINEICYMGCHNLKANQGIQGSLNTYS